MSDMLDQFTEWLKQFLISGIVRSLTGMYDSANSQIGEVAEKVGKTPAEFAPEVFSMIKTVSETVIIPIAGLILTYIACYELIQMLIEHNNLASFETWFLFRWVMKTFIAVTLVSNTFPITTAIFDVAQKVVNNAAGVITAPRALSISALDAMMERMQEMEVAELTGIYIELLLIRLILLAVAVVILIIVYGRIIEIYLMTSLAPLPFATFGNREQSQIGQNYLRSLCALGFQGFLIVLCIGIYAVMLQSVTESEDILASVWMTLCYTTLLCYTLLKTSSVSKSIFSAR